MKPTPQDILHDAAAAISQRGKVRDLDSGERSMARAVTAYNHLTSHQLNELDGWLFMIVLKLARATAGQPHLDDYTDLAGYAALAGELISRQPPASRPCHQPQRGPAHASTD